jgi:hypothetical protein
MKKGIEKCQEVKYWYTYPGGYGRTVCLTGNVVTLSEKTATIECKQINRHTGESRIIKRRITYKNIKESSEYIKPFSND